jgi:glycerol-3-phosphate dehydrogenase (NAD(P)+)
MKIFVLGAGSWGGTLAKVLSDNGNEVAVWEIDSAKAKKLDETRQMPFIAGTPFPKNIKVTSDISLIKDYDAVLVSVPSHFMRSTMEKIKNLGLDISQKLVISSTKGIENKTLKRMSEVIEEIFPGTYKNFAALSGPSHAEELSLGIPTLVTIASENKDTAVKCREMFVNDYFRIYLQNDVIGVELGAALKNVFAVAGGIIDGLNFGDNTKAAIITRGLKEVAKIGVALGGKYETFYGLSGLGDLIVTCFSKHSRNRSLGEMIGKGKSLEEAQNSMEMIAEGVKTSVAAWELGKKYNIELPIINAVYNTLFNGLNAREAVFSLMARDLKSENDA